MLLIRVLLQVKSKDIRRLTNNRLTAGINMNSVDSLFIKCLEWYIVHGMAVKSDIFIKQVQALSRLRTFAILVTNHENDWTEV